MARKNQDIIFRKIRGRIVPIRRRKSGKSINQLVVGTTLASAGIGTAVAGGIAARKLSKRSKKLATAAFRARGLAELAKSQPGRGPQLSLFQEQIGRERAAKLLGKSRRFRTGAKLFRLGSFRVKAGSIGLGGLLLGTGIEQILDKPIKRADIPSEVAKDFTVNLGAGLAAAVFVLGRGKVKGATLKKLFKRKK